MGQLEDVQSRIKKLDQLEKELRTLTRLTKTQMLYKIAKFTNRTYVQRAEREQKQAYKTPNEPALITSIHTGIKKEFREIAGVRFSLARHGIFYEHGVGKGRNVNSSIANNAARVWLKPVLNIAAEDIADLLAEKYADLLAQEVKISVPGIINTTITK